MILTPHLSFIYTPEYEKNELYICDKNGLR